MHKVPSDFTFDQKRALAGTARIAHQALGLRHFSRADLILTPRGPYLLEVNAIPGLYPGASFPPMLESIGSSVREFLEHAISLAKEGMRGL
jgi:D-alanine-D-alanine ligase